VNRLRLRPFLTEQLSLVERWFCDVETQRWLGGPDWPRIMLDRADQPLGEFRGARETGRYRWLAWHGDVAVGYIDCGTFDRWTTWDGGPRGRGVVATIEVPAGSIAYVVDPGRRRQGLATAMIKLLIERPELDDLEMFAAGVEPDNVASVRALAKADFHPLQTASDFEGIVYFAWRRGKRHPACR
jgi:RimJ/RimL family protein N-acetyltransferase